jgi:hypothetical protein
MSGGSVWYPEGDAAAYRQAADDLEAHVPHYVDAAGRIHSDVSTVGNDWTGRSGETVAVQTVANDHEKVIHADRVTNSADIFRKTANHIDQTNAASENLSAQRDSALASAKTPGDRIAANQNYANNLDALQNQHQAGMNDFGQQLAAQPRTELSSSGLPQTSQPVSQTPFSETSKPSSAPLGTGHTPGASAPPGATSTPTPRTFTGGALGEKLAAYSRGGGSPATLPAGAMGAQVTEPTERNTAAGQQSRRFAVAPVAAPIPTETNGQKVKVRPLAGMPPAQALGAAVLACLVSQFRAAGWPTPISVAAVRQGEEKQAVYATSAGLSVLPQNVRLPAQVLPLDRLDAIPSEQAAGWLGHESPTAKLTALLADTHWSTEQIVTTELDASDGKLVTGLDVVELHRVIESDAVAYPSVSRASLAKIDAENAEAAAAALRAEFRLVDDPLDLHESGRTLRDAGHERQGEYLHAYARWLLADAVDALRRDECADAGYPLGVLLHTDVHSASMR